MRIHEKEVYRVEDLEEIYPGMKPFKLQICESLSKKGYLFFAANNRNIGLSHKWEPHDPVLVGCSIHRNPRHLWAVKPVEDQQ